MKTIKIGIIGATNSEIEQIKKVCSIKNKKHIAHTKFYESYIDQTEIILVSSGIGKTSSSLASTILIREYSVNGIINVGLCGGIYKTLNIGDIIIANIIRYHDVNLQQFGYKKNQMALCPKFFYSYSLFIELAKKCSKILNLFFHIGLVLSGDSFINNRNQFLKKKYYSLKKKPLSIDMESASIAQICYLFKIPFISIRSISDLSDKDAIQDYRKNKIFSIKKYSILVSLMMKYIAKTI